MVSKKSLKKQSSSSKSLKRQKQNSSSNNASFKKAKADSSGSKLVPEYHINNKDGQGTVTIKLKLGQSVGVADHVISYYDSNLDINTRSQNGVLTGFFRKIATGDSIFKTFFTGTGYTKNELVLSSFLSGSVVPLMIKAGESYRISHNSLLAYTSNLKIKTKSRFGNILLQQGVFQEVFYNDTEDDGIIWLHSYGGHTEMVLKKGESKKVAHGLFIAADANLDYNVSTLKGVKSLLVGSTSTLLQFHGPCKVYIHNKNYNYLVQNIVSKVPQNKR